MVDGSRDKNGVHLRCLSTTRQAEEATDFRKGLNVMVGFKHADYMR